MNEYKVLTIEKLDKEEYAAAMKAIDEVRQKRANEAAKMQARQIIIDAVDKALELAHAVDLVDTLNELYIEVADAAEDEEREIMRDE